MRTPREGVFQLGQGLLVLGQPPQTSQVRIPFHDNPDCRSVVARRLHVDIEFLSYGLAGASRGHGTDAKQGADVCANL